MAIRFICPHCGNIIHVADALDGRQGQCPNCTRFAMIQGQHIPDGSVPELVDITTAPEGRSAGERTMLLQQGGRPTARGPAAAPPPTMAPTRVSPGGRPPMASSGSMQAPPGYAAPPYAPPQPTQVTRSFAAPGASGTGGYGPAGTGGIPVGEPIPEGEPDDMPLEEEGGVGVKKLVLSILAGAMAAVVIGLLVARLLPSGGGTNPDGTGPKPPDKDKPTAASFEGPIFKIKPVGKVAVLIYLSSNNNDGHWDFIKSELTECINRAARKNSAVTELAFCIPMPEGEKPSMVVSKADPKELGEASRWVNEFTIPFGGELKPAVAQLLDRKPDQLIVISGKALGEDFAKDLAKQAQKAKVTLYGIVFNTEEAKRDLSLMVNFDRNRLKVVVTGQREFGPASASDKDAE